jgi:hypothetical protein
MTRLRAKCALLSGACLALAGCDHAPNVSILGSYFPVWMVCLAAATVLAFGVGILLRRLRLESEVGPLALFYPCTVLLFSSLLWLIFFR